MPSTLEPPRSDRDFAVANALLEEAAEDLTSPSLPPRASMTVGVATLDRDLRYRRIDPALAEINGLSAEAHLGRTAAEIVPELAPVIGATHRRVMETGEAALSVPISGRTRSAPEKRRWLASYFPLPPGAEEIAAGRFEPSGVITVVREVDEGLTLRPRGVSDERFRELLTQSMVGLAQVDRDGTFLYVNERYCEITGWSRDELVGVRRHQDVTHPRDPDAAGAKFFQAMQTGEPYSGDKRLMRPDGSSVWVRNTVTVIPGPDGRPESLFTVAIDMTDRVLSQRALTRSERRLRLAAEAGGLGVWSSDWNRGVAEWSPEAMAIYGGQFPPQPTMKQIRARVHPDDLPLFDLDGERPTDGGPATVDVTHRVVHPLPPDAPPGADGEIRWVRALGERWFDEQGRPLRSVGVLQDVTEDREREQRLAEAEDRRRLVAEAAEMGSSDYDVRTGTVLWDDRAKEILGIRADGRTAFRTHFSRLHPDDADRVLAALRAAVDGSGPRRYAHEYRVLDPSQPDGVRWVRSENRAIDGPDGDVVRVVGCLRDVTAAKRNEQALKDARARLEEMNRQLEEANEKLEREVAQRTTELRTAAERIVEAGRQERDRIAHVLHDHLQQILIGAKMNQAVVVSLSEGESQELAERVSGLIDEAINESRSLSAELAPPILWQAGLGPALHWL
ncbi:MAG: PAS domain S-box protein, partial [Planctomycetota bacterium]